MSASVDDRLDALAVGMGLLLERVDRRWPRWLGIREASRYSSLGATSLRSLLSSGKLVAHRPVAGKVLVDRFELDRLIASSTGCIRHSRGIHNGNGKRSRAGPRKERSATLGDADQ